MLNITSHQGGNTNQNHNEIPFYALGQLLPNKTKQETITNVGEDVEKLERLCIVSMNIKNAIANMENNTAIPEKIKHRITI